MREKCKIRKGEVMILVSKKVEIERKLKNWKFVGLMTRECYRVSKANGGK